MANSSKHQRALNKKTSIFLFLAALVMLAFAYISVPIYRIFCQTTGYGGTTQVSIQAPGAVGNKYITIRFNADISKNLPWEFYPLQKEIRVLPGEPAFTMYRSINKTNKPISGMATYNVTPDKTGIYFNKIECFCFIQQTLKPYQTIDMPVMFYIDPLILKDKNTKDIETITLSYTFFEYTDTATY